MALWSCFHTIHVTIAIATASYTMNQLQIASQFQDASDWIIFVKLMCSSFSYGYIAFGYFLAMLVDFVCMHLYAIMHNYYHQQTQVTLLQLAIQAIYSYIIMNQGQCPVLNWHIPDDHAGKHQAIRCQEQCSSKTT